MVSQGRAATNRERPLLKRVQYFNLMSYEGNQKSKSHQNEWKRPENMFFCTLLGIICICLLVNSKELTLEIGYFCFLLYFCLRQWTRVTKNQKYLLQNAFKINKTPSGEEKRQAFNANVSVNVKTPRVSGIMVLTKGIQKKLPLPSQRNLRIC